jgi:hypothetical protein
MNISTALALTAPLTAAAARPLVRWMKSLKPAVGQGQAPQASACVTAHRLPRGRTLVIDKAMDQIVMCQSGCVWITYDHDPMDRIVEAGEQHRGCSHSRMLVHAVSDVRLTVTPVRAC